MDRSQPRRVRVFIRIGVLTIVLAGVAVVAFRVSNSDTIRLLARSGIPGNLSSLSGPGSDEEIAAMVSQFSGYWERVEQMQLPEKPFALSDRIEILNNGIVWQVRRLTVQLPNKKSVDCMQVLTAFIKPFKRLEEDPPTVVVDGVIMGEAFVSPPDTCYVASRARGVTPQGEVIAVSQRPYASQFRREGKTLTVDRERFTAYDTANGSLAGFFPEGSLGAVKSFSAAECREDVALVSTLRGKLRSCFDHPSGSGDVDQPSVNDMIEKYYKPLFVSEMVRSFAASTVRPLKGNVVVRVAVDPSGAVSWARISKGHTNNRYFVQSLLSETKSWRFPRSTGTKVREVEWELTL